MPESVQQSSIFVVGETKIDREGMEQYLVSIGNPEWRPDVSVSDAENLVIFGGRACYRSWEAYDETKPDATNPNVTRVRQDPKEYILNILKSGHGSVLEHANVSIMFKDVTRVFTHELVRHRAGCAYSQESLRYVRLNRIKYWNPVSLADPEKWFAKELEAGTINKDQCQHAQTVIEAAFSLSESKYSELMDIFRVDTLKDFALKKKLTSMFRRVAPIGLSTSIIATMNFRTLRHMIGMRSSPHAEEEIQVAFNEVGRIAKERWPLVFQDMTQREDGTWQFEYPKV